MMQIRQFLKVSDAFPSFVLRVDAAHQCEFPSWIPNYRTHRENKEKALLQKHDITTSLCSEIWEKEGII